MYSDEAIRHVGREQMKRTGFGKSRNAQPRSNDRMNENRKIEYGIFAADQLGGFFVSESTTPRFASVILTDRRETTK